MKIILLFKKNLLIFLLLIMFIMLSYTLISNSTHGVFIDLECNSSITANNFFKNIKEYNSDDEKIAFLTFDDGPTKYITPKILDILEEENIKATFFVIGMRVDSYPGIVKRAYDAGHYIANHGYDHNNANLYKSPQSFIDEIKRTDLAIGNAIGIKDYCSHIFRFPNGYMSPIFKHQKENVISILSELDYTYIDWNCLNKDSEKKFSNKQLIENLKNSSINKNTLVILMHDTNDVNDSSIILRESIKYLREQGYEFKNFYDIII